MARFNEASSRPDDAQGFYVPIPIGAMMDQDVQPSPAAIEKIASPAPPEAWDTIYKADNRALPSQSRKWANAIVALGGYRDVSRHYKFTDGTEAVLPLFAKGPRSIFTMAYSPPPAWGFGGLISDARLKVCHISAVLADLERSGAVMTQLRPNPLEVVWNSAVRPGWNVIPRTVHILDLAGGFDTVWKTRFRADARNRVRHAERSGIEIESGVGEKLVGEFHDLLLLSIERWARRQNEPAALARWRGLGRDPKSKFLGLAELAGPLFQIWVARAGGIPVASILVLRDQEAHYTRGAMDEHRIGNTYANYLLHSLAIKDACDHGCSHYNMGETGSSQSLAQFKSRFGAVPVQYAEFQYERLPIAKAGHWVRRVSKRLIGFRDV